jgi:hypothetical protein
MLRTNERMKSARKVQARARSLLKRAHSDEARIVGVSEVRGGTSMGGTVYHPGAGSLGSSARWPEINKTPANASRERCVGLPKTRLFGSGCQYGLRKKLPAPCLLWNTVLFDPDTNLFLTPLSAGNLKHERYGVIGICLESPAIEFQQQSSGGISDSLVPVDEGMV